MESNNLKISPFDLVIKSKNLYNLIKKRATALEDIKLYITKHGKIFTYRNEKKITIVDELLNLYCRGNREKEIINNEVEIIKYLTCECNVNVSVNCDGNTPLCSVVYNWCDADKYSCRSDEVNKSIIDILLQNGANINEYIPDRRESVLSIVLNFADKKDIVDKANYLISKGLDPKYCTNCI